MRRALTLPGGERRVRMRALRRRVRRYDVHPGCARFLQVLGEVGAAGGAVGVRDDGRAEPARGPGTHARAVRTLVLLLDYDGTLVP